MLLHFAPLVKTKGRNIVLNQAGIQPHDLVTWVQRIGASGLFSLQGSHLPSHHIVGDFLPIGEAAQPTQSRQLISRNSKSLYYACGSGDTVLGKQQLGLLSSTMINYPEAK